MSARRSLQVLEAVILLWRDGLQPQPLLFLDSVSTAVKTAWPQTLPSFLSFTGHCWHFQYLRNEKLTTAVKIIQHCLFVGSLPQPRSVE